MEEKMVLERISEYLSRNLFKPFQLVKRRGDWQVNTSQGQLKFNGEGANAFDQKG